MNDTPPNPELLRSLGQLVRGLSALFWGLPLTLIVCAATVNAEWVKAYDVAPPLAATGLLLFGLLQMGSFQKQERPWRWALDRAKFFALVNFGFSPFLVWWNRVPGREFFQIGVWALALSALLFLFELNLVLRRLGAMLPDEALRQETRQFTAVNRWFLVTWVVLITVAWRLFQNPDLPGELAPETWNRVARVTELIVIFFGLSPLAITMALIWKTKEVILDNVFNAGNH